MIAALVLTTVSLAPAELATGPWRAWLDCHGGELPFGLELELDGSEWRAHVVNGPERIPVPEVSFEDDTLSLRFPHYDSVITARLGDDAGALHGEWVKRRGPDEWTRMAFHATAGHSRRFKSRFAIGPTLESPGTRLRFNESAFRGRFRVAFESSEDPGVLVLEEPRTWRKASLGTFLTTTGDYRFLAGNIDSLGLRLSCFDGAHAFLFSAYAYDWVDEEGGPTLESDPDTLSGDFWSRDTWHETWTAVRDPDASLPDPFAETAWEAGANLAELVFPDLEGRPRSLADPAFAGKARIVQVFGSWCPNCHDEAPYLAELHERYADRGLSITALAFELTGDFERDAQQVEIYKRKYGIEFPILVGGLADKSLATAAFPPLDRVRSYPTTIFLRADGSVHSVHTGFSGPATGEAHRELRAEFEATIEELLGAEVPSDERAWSWLAEHTWVERGLRSGTATSFTTDAEGRRVATVQHSGADPRQTSEQALPVTLQTGTVAVGDELWFLDRRARVLTSPFDFGRRLSSDPRTATPLMRELGHESEAALVEALAGDDPVVRREALYAIGRRRADRQQPGLPPEARLGEDAPIALRVAGAWAAGVTYDRTSIPALLANMEHPYAGLRRESARALARIAKLERSLGEKLEAFADDPDPLVREALAR